MKGCARAVVGVVAASALACGYGDAPAGAFPTPPGDGPVVRWALAARSVPDAPLPNDAFTWPDPTSPTGRRVSLGLVPRTAVDEDLAEDLVELPGFSTTGPITVGFDAPIDVAALLERQAGTAAFASAAWPRHAIYLVDLETGLPVPLDLDGMATPGAILSDAPLFPNEPRAAELSLLFESVGEDTDADGVLSPAEDSDFDGALDVPNTLDERAASPLDAYDRTTWAWERESRTLRLRPLVPLAPERTHAVILTDRLVDHRGRPVRSPFTAIHPAPQEAALGALPAHLRARPDLYGDLAERGLAGVAFVWTFTTMAPARALTALRDGLAGEGELAVLGSTVAAEAAPHPMRGGSSPMACPDPGSELYLAPRDAFVQAVGAALSPTLGWDAAKLAAFIESYEGLAHALVLGIDTAYLLGDPERPSERSRLSRDASTAVHETATALVLVPREAPGRAQPFPTVVIHHDLGGAKADVLAAAGLLLGEGVAVVAMDAPGHGLADRTLREALANALTDACLAPAAAAILASRARDVDGDGADDPGALVVSPRLAHTRDHFLQSALDELALVRVLSRFDGRAAEPVSLAPPHGGVALSFDGSYAADGTPSLAGDFDRNGVPDLGGDAPIVVAGVGHGGAVAVTAGAIDPDVDAIAAVSPTASLADWAARSADPRARDAILAAWMGPVVVGVPSGGRSGDTSCADGDVSLRIEGTNGRVRASMEVGCLDGSRIGPNDVLVARDLSGGSAGCGASTSGDGRFFARLTADAGNQITIEHYRDAKAFVRFGACVFGEGAPPPDRVIESFEVTRGPPGPGSCASCATFGPATWALGDPLVVPATGLGLSRQSPSLRAIVDVFAPALLDGADPAALAPLAVHAPPPGATPRPLLVVATVGDRDAAVASAHALARASGLLPIAPADAPDFLADRRAPGFTSMRWPGSLTPADLLAAFHVTEGRGSLERHPLPAGPAFFVVDPDDASDGAARFDDAGAPAALGFAPETISPPLRLVRAARAASPGDDPSLFDPASGEPTSALVHLEPRADGSHALDPRALFDPGVAFDAGRFGWTALGRFVASAGRGRPLPSR